MSKVSIIMPNYNGAKFLSNAISCVINQDYLDWELLIFDDCSKDSSLEIARKFEHKDIRIKVYQNPLNSGTAKTRNSALKKASGDFIAFLDSDDWWESNFLTEQINALETNNADLVYCNYNMVDENGRYLKNINKFRTELTYEENLWMNHIGQLTGVFRRAAAPNVYYDESLGSIKDDYAFWLDVLKCSKLALGNNQTLAHYRISSNSVTAGKHKLITPHFNLLYRRQKIGMLRSFLFTANWAFQGFYNFHIR